MRGRQRHWMFAENETNVETPQIASGDQIARTRDSSQHWIGPEELPSAGAAEGCAAIVMDLQSSTWDSSNRRSRTNSLRCREGVPGEPDSTIALISGGR